MSNIYRERGYKNRQDYLKCMAEDHEVPIEVVESLAESLGPSEDFDGLIATLEDYYEIDNSEIDDEEDEDEDEDCTEDCDTYYGARCDNCVHNQIDTSYED